MYNVTIKTEEGIIKNSIDNLSNPVLAQMLDTPGIIEFKLEDPECMKLARKKKENEKHSSIIK